MGRVKAYHSPNEGFAPVLGIKPQSVSAATVNGTGIDLASKSGAYFTVGVGNVTDATNCTWTAFLQDSADNSTFANVNTTTYPEATIAASNTANTTGELQYTGGPGRKQYVRPVVTTVANAVLISVVGVTY
jgi:hypothetical protein